jgi:uncharacterized repeat protein (TIGR03803 family)
MKRDFLPFLRAVLFLTLATITAAQAVAATEQVLHTFNPFGHGGNPQASLIADAAGNLYGTASTGGIANGGLVFKLTPTSSGQWTETILHEFVGGRDGFEPLSGLVFDKAGNLFGTTLIGGSGNCGGYPISGCGVLYELSPKADGSWTERVIHTFENKDDGQSPMGNLTMDASGNLYGTTSYGGSSYLGSVFELSPTNNGTWTSKLLYEFSGGSDGCYPVAGIVFDAAGNLYGTTEGMFAGATCTSSWGTAFKLTPSPTGLWTETTIYTFTGGNDGGNSAAGLIFDNAGNLYGTASNGGCCQGGVVFELSPESNGRWKEKVILDFGSSNGGFQPNASLVFDANGNLYGTTFSSGVGNCYTSGCGVVFQLSPHSTRGWTPKTLYHFLGDLDGANPLASVIFDSAGNLYGTTVTGAGANCTWVALGNPVSIGCGTVFKLTPTSHGQWTETQLYTFPGTDGAWPSGLNADAAGNLYGTTYFGGAYGWGEVFKLIPSNGRWVQKILYSFTGNYDGGNPNGVILDDEGNLYGTATAGTGNSGCGVVFQLKAFGGVWKERVLHGFPTTVGADGCVPIGNLVFDSAGNLYGATAHGGGNCLQHGFGGCGIIFELSPTATGIWNETILHTFSNTSTDGVNPTGSLVFDSAGNLYGTTSIGGTCALSYGCGTVFELSPVAGGGWNESILYSFPTAGNSSSFPNGRLVLDAAGNLYGTTGSGGQSGCGEIFELSPSMGVWNATVLHTLSATDGCSPPAGLSFDSAGNLFGAAFSLGPSNCGTVFELSPSSGTWNFNDIQAIAGGSAGCYPNGNIVLSGGKLYGITEAGGGNLDSGVVFEITP